MNSWFLSCTKTKIKWAKYNWIDNGQLTLRLVSLSVLKRRKLKIAAFIQSVTLRDFFFSTSWEVWASFLKLILPAKFHRLSNYVSLFAPCLLSFPGGHGTCWRCRSQRPAGVYFQGRVSLFFFPGMFRPLWPWIKLHYNLFPPIRDL